MDNRDTNNANGINSDIGNSSRSCYQPIDILKMAAAINGLIAISGVLAVAICYGIETILKGW